MNDISVSTNVGVRTAEAVASIIARTNYADKIFLGTIEPMPIPMGDIAVQDVGRGQLIFHDVSKLDVIPTPGEIAKIQYDELGFGKVVSGSILK